MEIMVTNDDGIAAPGIAALARAASQLGNVTVIAPERNWSACGHQKTLGKPLRVTQTPFVDNICAYSTDGGPSDCTELAALGFLDTKFDLVISGINPTANLGIDLSYSGTVTSAFEATVWGLRGIAFSLDAERMNPDKIDFSAAARIIPYVIQKYMENDLPTFSILNINIPYLPFDEIKGYKITRCGARHYRDKLIERIDPFGRPYYWFGGEAPLSSDEENTDGGELKKGYISITPIQLDQTAYALIDPVSKWNWRK